MNCCKQIPLTRLTSEQGMEQVLQSVNKLNRSLEGVIAVRCKVGKKISSWRRFTKRTYRSATSFLLWKPFGRTSKTSRLRRKTRETIMNWKALNKQVQGRGHPNDNTSISKESIYVKITLVHWRAGQHHALWEPLISFTKNIPRSHRAHPCASYQTSQKRLQMQCDYPVRISQRRSRRPSSPEIQSSLSKTASRRRRLHLYSSVSHGGKATIYRNLQLLFFFRFGLDPSGPAAFEEPLPSVFL